jgi:exodeoxyribonuclease V alpha subunit
MAGLTATIKSIIFNKENFFILNTDKGKAKGYILDNDGGNIVGIQYKFKGEWVADKFGRIFKFDSAEMKSEQMFFFLAKVIKLGDRLALNIVDTFPDVEYIIENKPEELLKIHGIAKKRLKKILEGWDKYRHLRELSKFLGEYDVSANLVIKIYNKFGETAVNLIKQNPYNLTQIKGIGFVKADEIALKIGIEKDSPFRIIACAEHILTEEANNSGHCYLELQDLAGKVRELLNIGGLIETVIMTSDNFVIKEDGLIGFKKLYNDELKIYEYLQSNRYEICQIIEDEKIFDFIKTFEEKNKIKLSHQQKEAIFKACHYKIMTLTGYAGTGKSSTTKAIMELLSTVYTKNKIVGCALSGIASRRLSQVSGFKAFTIHSLLEFTKTGFNKNSSNPLDYSVVVVDECGMINASLFASLIDALPPHARLLLIGDDAQLPPIGAGNVFADIIHKNLTQTIRLNKIFRQSDESVINLFAQQIRNKIVPENYQRRYDDWFFVDCSLLNYYKIKNSCKTDNDKKALREQINNEILSKIIRIVDYNKSRIEDKLLDLQILVPQRKGLLGYDILNNYIQKILNDPDKKSDTEKVERVNRFFCVDDKIIHTENKDMKCLSNYEEYEKTNVIDPENCYTMRIFNGTLGLIKKIDFNNEAIIAEMVTGDIVVYDFIEAKDIFDLAYVLTVHKAQGSEFKNVIIPLSLSNYIMLQNQWLYTAITRAKSKCVLIGEQYAFETACKKDDNKTRNTWLKFIADDKLKLEAV